MPGSISFGNPLCWRAYGKIRYISRSKSRSVNTLPFTRATGLASVWVCALAVTRVVDVTESCEAAICARVDSAAARTIPQIVIARFMTPPHSWVWKEGRDCSLPSQGSEDGHGCAVVHLIGFAAMALTAELRRLVRSPSPAGGVIRRANEEHGLVVARSQTALGSGDFDHVHQMLVVA